MSAPPPSGTAILLSTFNGARFLREQLDSLLAQSDPEWTLFWRDDGSTDASVAHLRDFAGTCPRARHVPEPEGHLGPTASFMALLREAARHPGFDAAAFADQDDVWLPEKLARGRAALAALPADRPVIYCARQVLVDEQLRRIGESASLARHPGFPASLTQNVATGCTVMLNRAALDRVARSEPSPVSLHDWWCYLVVTAAGGEFVLDETPVVLYRQHGNNLVGAPRSPRTRALAALRRGPGLFMTVLRHNLDALAAQPHLLSPDAHAQVHTLRHALRGTPLHRLRALALPGLQRQTALETLLFRLWFLIG